MALSPQEQEIIKFGRANGKRPQEIEQAIVKYRQGFRPPAPTPRGAIDNVVDFGKGVAKSVGETAAGLMNVQNSPMFAVQSPEIRQQAESVANTNKAALGLSDDNLKATNDAQAIGKVAGTVAQIGAPFAAPALSKVGQAVGGIKAPAFAEAVPGTILQNVNRIPPSRQAAFEKMAGQKVGDYLIERGISSAPDKTIESLITRYKTSKETVDKALEALPGTFKEKTINTALKDLLKREISVSKGAAPTKDLATLKVLAQKSTKEGLTMSEINNVKRLYERNFKMAYNKSMSQTPEAQARTTHIDSVIRDWQSQKATELGFTNIKDLNKETQLAKQLADDLFKAHAGKEGNNIVSITDYILLSGDATGVSGFVAKKLLGSDAVRSKAAKVMSGSKYGSKAELKASQTTR